MDRASATTENLTFLTAAPDGRREMINSLLNAGDFSRSLMRVDVFCKELKFCFAFDCFLTFFHLIHFTSSRIVKTPEPENSKNYYFFAAGLASITVKMYNAYAYELHI